MYYFAWLAAGSNVCVISKLHKLLYISDDIYYTIVFNGLDHELLSGRDNLCRVINGRDYGL